MDGTFKNWSVNSQRETLGGLWMQSSDMRDNKS